LSGWPSETDSEVKRKALDINLIFTKVLVFYSTLDAAFDNRENASS